MFKKTFVAATVLAASLSYYFSKEETPKKLICSKSKFVTSHHRYTQDRDLLKQGKELLQGGEIKIKSDISYTKYSESTLKNFLTLYDLNDIVTEEARSFFLKQTNYKQRVLEIEFKIHENDREDPRKKSEFCSIHAGSINFTIRYENSEIYRAYSEFLRPNKESIRKQIQCIFNTFSNL